MSTHTPGPWKNRGPIGHGNWITAEGVQIAVTYGVGVNPNSKADTRLIAAAPDLLAALKAMIVMADSGVKPQKLDAALTWIENDRKAREMADAAIAKATGETPC